MEIEMLKGYSIYMKDVIENFYNENNRLPNKEDMKKANIAISPLVSKYGSWKEVLGVLGFGSSDYKTDVDVELGKLVEMVQRDNKMLTVAEAKEYGISTKCLLNQYNGWKGVAHKVEEILGISFLESNKTNKVKKTTNIEEIINRRVVTKKVVSSEEKEELSDKIIELTKSMKKIPQIEDLEGIGVSYSAIKNVFGSYIAAKTELDLKTIVGELNGDLLTVERKRELLENIIEITKSMKRVPTLKQLEEAGIDRGDIKKAFLSYSYLKRSYDLDSVALKAYKLSKKQIKELKDGLVDLTKSLRKVPSVKDLKENGFKMSELKQLGGYKKLKTELNLNEVALNSKGYTEEEKEELGRKAIEITQKMKKVPSKKEMKENGFDLKMISETFGNYANFVHEYGLKSAAKSPINYTEAEREEISNKLIELSKNILAVPTIKDVKQADISIKDINYLFGSYAKAKKALNLRKVVKIAKEDLFAEETKEIRGELLSLYNRGVSWPTMEEINDSEIEIDKLIEHYGSLSKAYKALNMPRYNMEYIKNLIIDKTYTDKKVPTLNELKEYNIGNDIKPEYIPIQALKGENSYRKIIKNMDLKEVENELVYDEIRELSNQLDKTPTVKEIKENGIKIDTVLNRKDMKWSGLRKFIGLPKRSRKYSNSEIKEIENQVIEVGKLLGRTPTLSEVKERGINYSILATRYDSWSNALLNLGFEPNSCRSKEVQDYYIEKIKKEAEKIGKAPTMKQLKEANIPTTFINKRFGSFSKFFTSMGIIPSKINWMDYDEETAMNDLVKYAKENGRVLTQKEARRRGIKVSALMKKLGPWKMINDAIKAKIAESEQYVMAI